MRFFRKWKRKPDVKTPHFTGPALAYLSNVECGEYTYGVPKVVSFDTNARLKIGKFSSIAGDVLIILGNGTHHLDWMTLYPFPEFWKSAKYLAQRSTTDGDVSIGNDVWLCQGCTILSGVTIGDGAVVGARAVVTHDVPPYALAVGNPASVVRYRFDQDTIDRLMKIRWWDWPKDKIIEHISDLCRPPEQFSEIIS